jgi:hypothetical protein
MLKTVTIFIHFKAYLTCKMNKSGQNCLQKLLRNEELEDDKGKRLPTKRVFALVIRYLKDDLLKDSEKQLAGGLEEEEIQWVLTVPAIWTPLAKQFMRECAIEVPSFSSFS